MRRVLAAVLVFHWAAVFSLLSALCVVEGQDRAGHIMRMFGLTYGGLLPVSTVAAAWVVALALALCAVLFWWALLDLLLPKDPREERDTGVVAVAFASASVLLTGLLIYGSTRNVGGLFPAIAAHLGALLVSYLAVRMYQVSAARTDELARAASRAIRERAMAASHATSLARFSAPLRLVGKDN